MSEKFNFENFDLTSYLNYADEEDDEKKIYFNDSGLIADIIFSLENDPDLKDYIVETDDY